MGGPSEKVSAVEARSVSVSNGRLGQKTSSDVQEKTSSDSKVLSTTSLEDQHQLNYDAEKRPECFSSTLQEIMFVFSCTMAIAQTSFFGGTVVGLTASIGTDLNMSAAEITWISASNALAGGAFLLLFGKAADLFGRKPIFIAGMGAFSLLLLGAGFARNAILLDCICGLTGLASSAVLPPAVGTLGAVYEKPSRRKNAAFGCFSAGNPIGFAVGALASGVAAKIFDWRASFWLLAIVYALLTIMTVFVQPPDQKRPELGTFSETLKQFDILGTTLSVMGFAMLCSSLTLSNNAASGWKTGYVIALLVSGVVAIGLFISWQYQYKYPIMPLYIWKDKNFTLLMVITCVGFTSFAANNFWVSLFLQRVRGLSALEIAVQLLPQAIGGILVNIVIALVLHRVSNRLLMGVSVAAYTGAGLLLSFMGKESSYWAFLFPSLLLSVIGADVQFSVTNMYVMSSLPGNQQSLAGGIFNTALKLSQAVGLGISTSIYTAAAGEKDTDGTAVAPYATTFYFATALAGASILAVFFLDIRTQGGKSTEERTDQ